MKHIFYVVIVAFLLTGCAMTQQAAQSELVTPYYHGDSAGASAVLEKNFDHELPLLFDASIVRFNQGLYTETISLLNESEAAVKEDETESDFYAGSKIMGETVFNRSFMNYEPTNSDAVLLNMYKGYSHWALGEKDKARVEFNRTLERQRRAVEKYKEDIAELQKETKELFQQQQENIKRKKSQPENSPQLDMLRVQEAGFTAVQKRMPELNQWKGYGDFVNPYATYMSGLFFCMNGEVQSDFDKCTSMMKRVEGMLGSNSYVAQDVKMANAYSLGFASSKYRQPTVWVIFENGLAPELSESRFTIPLFLVNYHTKVSFVSFVMPTLEQRKAAMNHLLVTAGERSYRSETLTNMDAIFQAEYKAQLPLTLTKAVASTSVKAFAQYLIAESGGQLAGLAAGIFTTVINTADTRSWLSLPKNVQLIRLNKPENGKLMLQRPDGTLLSTVKLPDSDYILIHVRMPTRGAKPYIQTFSIAN